MTRIAYTLLENGLDFIWSALERLGSNPGPADLKYAVLHLSSGVELILKEKLRREHWSLTFERPEHASWVKYQVGEFTSVSFQACLKRLVDVCRIKVSEDQTKQLVSLRDRRNRLEHFGIVDTVEGLTFHAARAVGFVIDFVNDELSGNLDEREKEALDKIRKKLGDFEIFVKQRMAVLQDRLAVETKLVKVCPWCNQKSLVVSHGATCLFCHYSSSPEEAAADYIGNHLGDELREQLYNCVGCGGHAVVFESEVLDSEYVCFDCGHTWPAADLTECIECGDLFAGRPGIVCEACQE